MHFLCLLKQQSKNDDATQKLQTLACTTSKLSKTSDEKMFLISILISVLALENITD